MTPATARQLIARADELASSHCSASLSIRTGLRHSAGYKLANEGAIPDRSNSSEIA